MQKWSQKYMNHWSILKWAKIGIEIEFFSNHSYYKTIEKLNIEFNPIKIHGFRQYHPTFTPDDSNFILTPDLSGGQNMCEFITGPLNFFDARYTIIKMFKWIEQNGYTNEKASIHFNISFDDESGKSIRHIDILKHILNVDEDEVYQYFPNRAESIYAKSIVDLIPFRGFSYNNISMNVVKNNMSIPLDKYYGVNYNHLSGNSPRVEYRYIGGTDYHKKISLVCDFMTQFILQTWNSINVEYTPEDAKWLSDILTNKINYYKSFSKYDSFLSQCPTIELQIDKNSDYDIVNAYYPQIWDKVFELLYSVEKLEDCLFNYDTEKQILEVVDAEIEARNLIRNVSFINCELYSIMLDNGKLFNCEIKDAQLTNCDVSNSDIFDSKLIDTDVEGSELKNCYFDGGELNSYMENGIFRSGKIGPYGELGESVKKVNVDGNFFNKKLGGSKKNIKKPGITGF